MNQKTDVQVRLRPWSEGDLALLHRLLGDPRMTEHLGGPERPEQIAGRHQRYLDLPGSGGAQMLVIVVEPDAADAGSIGYWEKERPDQTVYEVGWSVLPEFQGMGVATQAFDALLAMMRPVARHRYVHAYPSVDNGASNAICRKAGMTLVEVAEFEYPKGHLMRCNDWQLDLQEGAL